MFCCQKGLFRDKNTAVVTAVQYELLSEWPSRGRKYSRADSSAVRVAVRMVFQRAKIQQGRQQYSASCCQNGRFRGDNTAVVTAVQCGVLSEWSSKGQKYSRADSTAVRPAVSNTHPAGNSLFSSGCPVLLDLRRPALAPIQRIFRNEHVV